MNQGQVRILAGLTVLILVAANPLRAAGRLWSEPREPR